MHNSRDKTLAFSCGVILFVWAVNGIYLSMLSRVNPTLYWIADVVQWVFLPSAILSILTKKHHLSYQQLGLNFNRSLTKMILMGIIAAITFYPSFILVRNAVWLLIDQPSGYFIFAEMIPMGWLGRIAIIYSAITAGVVESILFIALPFLLWSRYMSKGSIMFSVVVSLTFAFVHWEQGLHIMAGALVFNIVACAWYFKWGNLWPVIIGHTVIDLIIFW